MKTKGSKDLRIQGCKEVRMCMVFFITWELRFFREASRYVDNGSIKEGIVKKKQG